MNLDLKAIRFFEGFQLGPSLLEKLVNLFDQERIPQSTQPDYAEDVRFIYKIDILESANDQMYDVNILSTVPWYSQTTTLEVIFSCP